MPGISMNMGGHLSGGLSPVESPVIAGGEAPSGADPGNHGRTRVAVLGVPIDIVSWREALNRIASWASAGEARVVVTCNVHSVVTADSNAELEAAIRGAEMSTADGMPVAWLLSALRRERQERIAGPDLMWHYCGEAAGRGEKIFLFGSTERTLGLLVQRLQRDFPGLDVVGTLAPPWGDWSVEDNQGFVERIRESGAQVVFVGLGCPKQEIWMHRHRHEIPAVMIGVGAAFDFYAGTVPRAPLWMQKSGLEWTWRLAREPRRLFGRYLRTNARFVVGALAQLIRS